MLGDGVLVPLVNSDGKQVVSIEKPFYASSKSFVSVDYSDKRTWWYDSADVADEELSTSDNLLYTSAHQFWIDKDRITDRVDISGKDVVVKKNGVVITSGFTIDHVAGQVVFSVANDPSDVVKVSYSYPLSSKYELIPQSGKLIKLGYVESQFSAGCTFNDSLLFEAVYNGPAVPAMGIPANTDVVVRSTIYKTAADFINKSNQGSVVKAFGELTQDVNILPWNYLTGNVLRAPGDPLTDISKGEINKIRMRLTDNTPYTNCEIATGTFYVTIEPSA